MNKVISIVVVNYNGKRFLEKLFTSIRHQTYSSLEVICVDSASKDDSVSFIKKEFPEVWLIEAENKGFGSACNRGAQYATGDFVVFLNEDMYIPPDFVERLYVTYQSIQASDPAIGALGCNLNEYNGEPNYDIFPGKIDCVGFPAKNRKKSKKGALIPGCPFFISRKLFLESGGFCEFIFLYCDDMDLSWRLTLMGRHQYTAPEICLYHYGGGSIAGFPPRKIGYLIFGTSVALFNNYSTPFLFLFLPLNLLFIILIVAPALFVFTRGNIRYMYAALRSVVAFVRIIPELRVFRKKVQQLRRVSDRAFLREHGTWLPALLTSKGYKRL